MTAVERLITEVRELKVEVKKLSGSSDAMKEEPINETEACKFLGITHNTMRIYVSQGKMAGKYTINCLGKRMFYKSKLFTP